VMKNYINEYSDSLDARIYAANALGEERAVVEGMQLGAGATCHIGGTAIHNNFVRRMGVLDLPFMWKGYDHAHNVLDGPVGQTLAKEYEGRGIKVLGWQDSWGYRNVVTSKKEIKTAADLKGLKIRTIQTPTYVAALNAMGASATPMAFGEVYTALQTGVLDGFEHAPPVVLTGKYYEIAKYVTLTGHLFGPTVTACSMKEWSGYTDKERAVLAAAAKMAQDVNRNLSSQRDAEALEALKGRGMIINQIDKQPFISAAAPVQDDLAKQIGAEDLLRTIRATK
jgi:tripartite ATP-independent transporter DctP family solute receptor